MSTLWAVRLGRRAELDYVDALDWTAKSFGKSQAATYAETISQALQALKDGPEIPGSKRRDEIHPGIWALHIARSGRKGRHFIVFRVSEERAIDVLRLLHDSMDLTRHLQTR